MEILYLAAKSGIEYLPKLYFSIIDNLNSLLYEEFLFDVSNTLGPCSLYLKYHRRTTSFVVPISSAIP